MATEVARFLSENGLQMYACIMDDQGFEDLADLIALTSDEAQFRELIPALGHRTKIKRLLLQTPPDAVPVPAATSPITPVMLAPSGAGPSAAVHAPGDVPKTPAVEFLEKNNLGMYSNVLRSAGYDEIADLTSLVEKQELFEHLVPVTAHRERMKRLLMPNVNQWLNGIRITGARDAELGSTESLEPLLPSAQPLVRLAEIVGGQYVRRGEPVVEDDASSASDKGPVRSNNRSQEHTAEIARRSPATKVKSDTDIYIKSIDASFDKILFVDNNGLRSAAAGANVPLCNLRCQDPNRCSDLHFREFDLRLQHMRKKCSAAYVVQITAGLLAVFKNPQERLVACTDYPGCSYGTACNHGHIALPIERAKLLLYNEDPNLVCVRDLCPSEGLWYLMSRHVSLCDRKVLSKVKCCPSFTLGQTCLRGSYCYNYHVMPPSFVRYFFKAVNIDKLMRHVHSLNHFAYPAWDVAKRNERTPKKNFEVAELLDFMLNTSCRPCSLILFDAFKHYSKRQSHDLLWAILHRMQALNGKEDPLMIELVRGANNALQLKQENCLSATMPLGKLVPSLVEALHASIKKNMLSRQTHHEGGPQQCANVYWDFDNIMFAERFELSLFFHCLMHYLLREGYAASKNSVHVKAFGVQHSFQEDTVDALRDMQVEIVLCSSKKQEETDRQMERSMRTLESRPGDTIVILSSDKDFGGVAKDLSRNGVTVVIVHCAPQNSSHEAVLSFTATHTVNIFDVYASPLRAGCKQLKPAPRSAAAATSPPVIVKPSTAFPSVPAYVDPAVVAQSTSATSQGRSVADFFAKSKPAPSAQRVLTVAELEESLQQKQSSAPAPSVSVASLLRGASVPSRSIAVVPLVDLVQLPRPPQEHRVWYTFFEDSYLQRLLDRRAKGELRGPLAHNATEDSVRREIRLYLEMAQLVPQFLPEWFKVDVAFRHLHTRCVDESPDDWLDDVHYLSAYAPEQLVEAFEALRYVATVIEGPLPGATTSVNPPQTKLRLTR